MQPLLGSLVCLSRLICILHQQPPESTETKVCGSTHLELSDGVLSLYHFRVKAFGNLLYEIRSNPHWLLRPFLDLSQHGLYHKSQRLWCR